MRFLFGIVIGAALTLLIATTTNAPTNPVLNRVTDLWDQLIDTTSQRLFVQSHAAPSTAATTATPSTANKGPGASETMETAATPITPLAIPQQATAIDERLVETSPAPTAVTLQPPQQAGRNTSDSTQAVPDLTTQIPTEPLFETTPERTAAARMAAEAEPETPAGALADKQIAAVWVPFHSERSANGFADTLSRHFEYPFNVRRNGPGAYQVTFSYADLAQREHLLLGITELTGK